MAGKVLALSKTACAKIWALLWFFLPFYENGLMEEKVNPGGSRSTDAEKETEWVTPFKTWMKPIPETFSNRSKRFLFKSATG